MKTQHELKRESEDEDEDHEDDVAVRNCFTKYLYTSRELDSLRQEMESSDSIEVYQFVLRLMKQKQHDKAIQVLRAFHTKLDPNTYVNDTYGSKVQYTY